MKRKAVNEIKEGDRVAIDIYDSAGIQLLKRGLK